MTTDSILVRPLTPSLAAEFFGFFEGEAFSDNPEWGSCYCMLFQFPEDRDWGARTGPENRADKAGLIAQGKSEGYLASFRDVVVGWCHVAPKLTLTQVPLSEGGDEFVGAIVCFVVAPSFRRRGVATLLLAAACEGLQRRGMKTAEAYPRRDDTEGDGDVYHGPLAMYLTAGFNRVREDGKCVIVRKSLAPDG